MLAITPVVFVREGRLWVRALTGDPTAVVDALRERAVFAFDTALWLARGRGFLTGGDVFAYVDSLGPLEDLVTRGLVASEPCRDDVPIRAWPGPPRLLACVVDTLPEWRGAKSGARIVTPERLRQELIGTVGARADLFALTESL